MDLTWLRQRDRLLRTSCNVRSFWQNTTRNRQVIHSLMPYCQMPELWEVNSSQWRQSDCQLPDRCKSGTESRRGPASVSRPHYDQTDQLHLGIRTHGILWLPATRSETCRVRLLAECSEQQGSRQLPRNGVCVHYLRGVSTTIQLGREPLKRGLRALTRTRC